MMFSFEQRYVNSNSEVAKFRFVIQSPSKSSYLKFVQSYSISTVRTTLHINQYGQEMVVLSSPFISASYRAA
jgi:hypothetical protein